MSTGNIDRFDLPNGQWADIFRRPSHGQMKQIERMTREAIERELALEAEDAVILSLVNAWHVLDLDGNAIPLKRDQLVNVPQDTMSLLMEELQGVVDATRPNEAISRLMSTLTGLRGRLNGEQREKMDAGIALVREALSVPVPNAPSPADG